LLLAPYFLSHEELEGSVMQEQTLNERDIRELLDNEAETSSQSLTEDQQRMLSKVLFPETHQEKVMLCGKERALHVLPLKWDRKLHAATIPFATAAEDEENRGKVIADLDKLLDQAMHDAVAVLCEAYGKDWYDVKQALEDEELLVSEMQAVAVAQQGLQGQNNFFLMPLRTVVRVMRAREIFEVRQGDLFGMASIGLTRLRDLAARSQN
jgi:hypothetical protein